MAKAKPTISINEQARRAVRDVPGMDANFFLPPQGLRWGRGTAAVLMIGATQFLLAVFARWSLGRLFRARAESGQGVTPQPIKIGAQIGQALRCEAIQAASALWFHQQ